MDPDDFADGVRDRNDTALSRLGSSKSLYADTAGEMETEAVLRAAATAEHHAAETYRGWADDEDDDRAREAWATTADEEADHYAQVADRLDDDHDPDSGEVPAIQEYLRGLSDPVERAGAFVGRTVAADKSKEQVTGFFVGQADPQTADAFRGMRSDLDAQLERGLDLLDALCEDDADWERAADAADEAIQTAYAEYTETLEGMGVNPKPVC
jgi:hypothetical protein